MISNYKMFSSFQFAQYIFRFLLALMHEVSKDVHVIPICYSAIPVPDKNLIHFGNRSERPIAKPDDSLMPQVQIRCKVSHTDIISYFHSFFTIKVILVLIQPPVGDVKIKNYRK